QQVQSTQKSFGIGGYKKTHIAMLCALVESAQKNDYCHRKIESVWFASKSVMVGTIPACGKFWSAIDKKLRAAELVRSTSRSTKKIFGRVHGFKKKSGNCSRFQS